MKSKQTTQAFSSWSSIPPGGHVRPPPYVCGVHVSHHNKTHVPSCCSAATKSGELKMATPRFQSDEDKTDMRARLLDEDELGQQSTPNTSPTILELEQRYGALPAYEIGRPSYESMFANLARTAKTPSGSGESGAPGHDVAVFACGPELLLQTVKGNLTSRKGTHYPYHFYWQRFEF